ncbi:MAG: SPOR domain-containing protein [Bacteroidia bacterium]|nr:SPOR domain-containing protein [Bacteroidia bacterium]
MAQIDFQSYFALLAAELPRFSIPGIGSFVWHVEKAQVDPKAGSMSPPRPTLKYEPGHRYQADTVAFLQEYFGIPSEEAEALLREVGRLSSSYLRATNEMDLWKFGKVKKVGAIYKVEFSEGAPIPFTAELYEVSLRATAGAAAPVSISAPPRTDKSAEKAKSQPTKPEASRAKIVEDHPQNATESQSTTQAKRRWSVVLALVSLLMIGIAGGVFWMLKNKKAKQPVEIVISKSSSSSAGSSSSPEQPKETPSTKTPTQADQKPKIEEKPSPPPKKTPPQPYKEAEKPVRPEPVPSSQPSTRGPKYYIIVGSYPSRAEAEAKANQFSGYRVEYLPGKEPGWVRLSIYSSSDAGEAQRKLREIKSRIPDAWVFRAE